LRKLDLPHPHNSKKLHGELRYSVERLSLNSAFNSLNLTEALLVADAPLDSFKRTNIIERC
jgi:hypothetical protein